MEGISQDFSNCGLRNDKSTKNSPRENCVNRASIESSTPILFHYQFDLLI